MLETLDYTIRIGSTSKLESELGLLASKRISEIDKLVNRIDSLEVKLGNSLNNTVIVENSREGNNVKDCQENLIVYEQNEINYQGNQRSISSSKIVYNNETPNWNNIKSTKKVNQQCITPETKATFIKKPNSTVATNTRQKSHVHPVLPSKKVKVKAHLDSPPRTRPLPQIPEWLSCLHLIETPELIDREIGEDNSTNCYVIKNNINNHNKSHDMRQTISTQPPLTQNRPHKFQPYQSFFPKRQRIKHSPYRHFRRSRTKEWLNYLDFVHQAMRNN